MAVLATRLPKDLRSQLDAEIKVYETSFVTSRRNVGFLAKALRATFEALLSSCPDKERASQERRVEPLLNLAKYYEGGR